MLLYYIRHGDPIYNPDSLTDLGKRQAEALSRRLAAHGIDRIFASPSTRAVQTAEPTAPILKKDIELLDFCHENLAWADFSVPDTDGENRWIFDNGKYLELFASREVFELGRQWYTHPEFKGFNFKAGVERIDKGVDEFLLSLGYEHDRERALYRAVNGGSNERIALFAHQGFGMSFISSVLDMPYPQVSTRMDITHSGISVFYFDERAGVVVPKLLMLSNDSHIFNDRLPTKYNNFFYV